MRQHRWRTAIGTFALLLGTPGGARATYSITAVDRATAQVGGAGTSCISGSSVYRIYGSSPGLGAVNSQARNNVAGRDAAVRLLEQRVDPADIVRQLTDPAFDGDAELRQYGIVDLMGRAAGHSGASTLDHSSDLQGSAGSFVYSIQGNILTGRAVLTQARDAFDGGGCDLADKLMRGLEGGAANGEGDSRCTPAGIPTDAAYIQVDRPDEPRGSFLRLEVRDTAPRSAVAELRERYDAWRVDHPCPTTPAPADAGAPDARGPDAGAPAADAGGRPPLPDGSLVDAGAPSGPAPTGRRSSSGVSGCGCRTERSTADSSIGHGALFLFAVAALISRARQRR